MIERVVIVDDEEGILALLRRVLRAPGREIEVFPSPLHALPSIRRHRPDVVISDLHMPGMSGPDFVRTLRDEFGARLGIIVITAFPSLIADADAVANGVGAYLRKPFTDLELLRTTVAEVIEAARRAGETSGDAEMGRRLAAAHAAQLHHRASLSRADAVMQSIGDAIVLLDRDRRIQQLNSAAANFLDLLPEDCLGRDLADLKIDPGLKHALLDDRGSELRQPRTTRIALPRGGRIADITTVPLIAAGGGSAGAFAVIRDATAEVRVQELKHHYLSVVAHELRTPLTALSSFAACLARSAPQSDLRQHQLLGAMRGQLLRLERQIDKLLALAELERGAAPVAVEPFAIAGALDEALSACRVAAEEKGVALTAEPCDAALQALGCADDLRRAVAELVENAVKFTPAGGRVDVGAAVDSEEVAIAIRDNGIGIAPEHHEAIFAGFRQLEDPLTRAHQGTGLGLSLAARMVASNGGRITVESAPGAGSTFILRLRAATAAPAIA